MDLRKLKTLIDLVEASDISELELTEGEEKVKISRQNNTGSSLPPANYVQQPIQPTVNQQPNTGGPTTGRKAIIRGKPRPLPNQYLANQADTTSSDHPSDHNDKDEQVQTFLSSLDNMNFQARNNSVQTYRANLHYLVMLSTITTDLCIVDGGADSHVGGRH